jgi:hypothetical protein
MEARGFLFPKTSDTWLGVLRIGLGLQVIFYCLSLWPDWNFVFLGGGNGLISRDLTEAVFTLDCPFLPRLSWFVEIGSHLWLRETTVLSITLFCFLASGCFLTAGLCCRSAAIVAWFLHLAAATSGGLMTYGVDNFMTIGLFYLMWSPLPDRFALDSRFWRRRARDPQLLGFFQRVLQLHLCFIYFFGGLDKCLGLGWWNGASVWRALLRPPFNVIPPQILVHWSYLLPPIGILVCLIETGYPVFIWSKNTRLIWLTAVLTMHIGIALAMGLYLFASIMIILNLAAFGPGLIQWRGSKLQMTERIRPESAPLPT